MEELGSLLVSTHPQCCLSLQRQGSCPYDRISAFTPLTTTALPASPPNSLFFCLPSWFMSSLRAGVAALAHGRCSNKEKRSKVSQMVPIWPCCCLVAKSHSTLLRPHGFVARQADLSMGFPSKTTGVGCHFLLQGIFSTQGLNLCLLKWQLDSLPLSHLGSPYDLPR